MSLRVILVGLVLVAAGIGAWWWAASADPAAAPSPEPVPSPSPTQPTYALDVTIRRVKAIPVRGSVKPRKLRAPAEAVRRTFTDLYDAAFVDRSEGGAFLDVLEHFAPQARQEARRHLDDLTLGRAAEHVSAVRPEWARLDMRFLVGPARVPVAAQASMRFAATAFARDGTEVPVRHRGEYTLERLDGRWLIVSYEVDGGFGPKAVPS